MYRGSTNLLSVSSLVDYYVKDANGKPSPVVSGVTVTAQVFATDKTTELHTPAITLTQPDSSDNYYHGLLPSSVDLSAHNKVQIKFIIDGGTETSYHERWLQATVQDS